jgi:hypothetical protein
MYLCLLSRFLLPEQIFGAIISTWFFKIHDHFEFTNKLLPSGFLASLGTNLASDAVGMIRLSFFFCSPLSSFLNPSFLPLHSLQSIPLFTFLQTVYDCGVHHPQVWEKETINSVK